MSVLSSTNSGRLKVKANYAKWGLDPDKITLNPDGTIDYDGNVDMGCRDFGDRLPVRFNKVTGFFSCANHKLASLEGAPKKVHDSFFCNNCGLTSLEGGPEFVGEIFDCSNNSLVSLDGCPKTVLNKFYCSDNKLTSLYGISTGVKSVVCVRNKIKKLDMPKGMKLDTLMCSENELETLECGPDVITNFLSCESNAITTLKGMPKVEGTFKCSYNMLTNLEGCSQSVNVLICINNELVTLEGVPKKLKELNCDFNHITSLDVKCKTDTLMCAFNEITSFSYNMRPSNIIDLSHNKLTSFKHMPKKLDGRMCVAYNPISAIDGVPRHIADSLDVRSTYITEAMISILKKRKVASEIICSTEPYEKSFWRRVTRYDKC